MAKDDFGRASDFAVFKAWQEGERFDDDDYDEDHEPLSPSVGPSLQSIIREFEQTVLQKIHLSRTQLDAFILQASGKTQVEIAKKLKKTQQAISKAIDSGRKKIEAKRNELGGPHDRIDFQAMHWWRTKKE